MANLGTAISPAPAVTCFTTGGAVATGYTGDVTVSLSSNPTGATLGGTLTVSASSGVATFSNLTLNRSGKNFRLSATAAGLRSVTSAAFSIPTQLVFTTQPAFADAGQTLDPVVVTVRDGAGNTDTEYTGNVTIAIYTASAAGTLSGTLTVAAVAGVATFSTLSISANGTYTFIASAAEVSTAYKPSSVVSNAVSIGFVLTAVADVGLVGFLASPALGDLTPDTFGGETIIALVTFDPGGPSVSTTIAFAGLLAQSFFTSLTIGNATPLLSADAVHQQGGGNTSWSWAGADLISAGTFNVSIQ